MLENYSIAYNLVSNRLTVYMDQLEVDPMDSVSNVEPTDEYQDSCDVDNDNFQETVCLFLFN